MNTRRLMQGWPWLYVAVAALGAIALLAVPGWKVHWSTYLELFWGLLWLSVCGFVAMTGWTAARRLIRISAVAVAILYLLNVAIVQSNAPYYGGTDWSVLCVMLGVILCAVISFMAARVHPNRTVEAEAQQAARGSL